MLGPMIVRLHDTYEHDMLGMGASALASNVLRCTFTIFLFSARRDSLGICRDYPSMQTAKLTSLISCSGIGNRNIGPIGPYSAHGPYGALPLLALFWILYRAPMGPYIGPYVLGPIWSYFGSYIGPD